MIFGYISNIHFRGPRRPVTFFWTPNYWYRPRSAKDAYQELQTHLNKLRQFHQRKRSKVRNIDLLLFYTSYVFNRKITHFSAESS